MATPAGAHGFGQRYELPLPLSLYLYGAATVVVLSFVVFGLFVRRAHVPRPRAEIDLLATRVGRALAHPAVVLALRLAVLGLFVVTVAAGLIGDQNPYRNIAPTLVWIIWWVGLAYVAAFAGDLWALVNPWRSAFDAVQWLCRRLGRTGELGLSLTVSLLVMLFLGGVGSLRGVLIGAVAFTALPEILRMAPTWRMVIYGLLLLVIVIRAPAGLAPALGRRRRAPS